MLHSKDIHNIDELQNLLRLKEKAIDVLIDYVSFFDFRSVTSRFDSIKQKGYSFTNLLSVMLVMPFLHMASLRALLASGFSFLSEAEKDAYYRLKNNPDISWREILFGFTKKYKQIILDQGTEDNTAPKCLVLDDSVLEKVGKKIERVGKLWDHVSHSWVLGFKLLCLGYYDGKSFIPLDFSLHREKGSNKKKQYGLTKKERGQQYFKTRNSKSPSRKRIAEMDSSKIDNAIKMVKRAVNKGFDADYVLMDSWFTCEKIIKEIQGIKKCCIHVLGMAKMAKAKYEVNEKGYTAKQLVALSAKKIKRCRKLNAHYIPVRVNYKGVPLQLFFCRYGSTGKWHLITTTDLTLTFIKAMKIYQVRWTIEVFFKESKQHLGLGKCQSNDLDAHFADTTVSMIQYVLLTLKKRFEDYETKGALFKASQEQIMELTLLYRLWGLFIEIVTQLAELFSIDIEQVMANLFQNEKANMLIKKLFKDISEPELRTAT
jgi:predicted nucleic acid-binding Zn finger protein